MGEDDAPDGAPVRKSYTDGARPATSRRAAEPARVGRPSVATGLPRGVPAAFVAAMLVLSSAACDAGPSAPVEDDEGTAVLEILAGSGQTGAAGQLLADPVQVRLTDRSGAPLVGVFLGLVARQEGTVLAPVGPLTDAAGRATFRWWLAPAAGDHAVTVAAADWDIEIEVDAVALDFPDVDAVEVAGWSEERPIGALVGGTASFGEASHFRFVGTGPTLGIGDWRSDRTAGGGGSDVSVFRPGAGFLHRSSAGFTPAGDTVRFTDDPLLALPLTVWMAAGDREDVETALATAQRIFEEEGLGVTIGAVEFVEGVSLSDALLDFTCGDRAALQAAAGSRDGTIDVYVVDRVDGSASRGQACEIGGRFVALGRLAGHTLLAHEIGHNLSLLHVDRDRTHFDRTNVMHSASDIREALTEGQVFRARLNDISVVNATFGDAAPEALRRCLRGTDPLCPPVELRLWGDPGFGPWPAEGAGTGTSAGAPGGDSPLPYPTCALEADSPGGVAGPTALPRGPGSGPAVSTAIPEPWRIDAARRIAARRARENARWLESRGGPPPWLRVAPARAVDPTVAADDAERRLRAVWREHRESGT